MTVNLEEFMKVFTVVFAMSGVILLLRHFIVNYDEYEEEHPQELNDRINVSSGQVGSDFIDYDGMGNQGRFPASKREKR